MTETALPSILSARALFTEAWRVYRLEKLNMARILSAPILLSILNVFLIGRQPFLSFALSLAAGLAQIVATAALIRSFSLPNGFARPLGAAYRDGGRFVLPLIWMNILFVLVFFGGLVLLVVPAFTLLIFLSLGVFVLLAEEGRGRTALARSWFYVRGRWWPVLWRYVAIGVFNLLLVGVLMLWGLQLFSFQEFSTFAPSAGPSVGFLIFQLLVQLVSWLVLTPISVTYLFRLYETLRATKPCNDPAAETFVAKKRVTLRNLIILALTVGVLSVVAFVIFAAFLFGIFLKGFVGGL